MSKLSTLKLRQIATDAATGLSGMITHILVERDERLRYLFQPKGLNEETGHPVKSVYLEEARFKKVDSLEREEHELPMEALGTTVTDRASGFTGSATAFVIFPTGCVHITIQPEGTIKTTGEPIQPHDINILQLEGKALPKLTAEEEKKDIEKKPGGPSIGRAFQPRFPGQ